ncbi:hypothetical protein DTO013E5_9139 [Penicillium roqueforti]|uniref:AAA+ ATPase domain-containing protein n=1 Tax=Penicillium nordicum TaxID=229535 RepID=A0A0M9WA78_9EURO|nr:hypothetical protein LCP963914a_6716 [Penicillium roqueforti]KOS37189.1 hypothetical protein ACN38_g12028 [Penicillium nordicum]KAI2734854.1 hypothetical protein DTO012A1_9696 [Penicillium roqueforti]KAI2741642.1 hypothetical protein DTO013F2_8715 [Penicillium roqueforti]KAI2765709.1 hypothetical protein DTO012A8_9069 [Penicillium roqueforti]
MKKQISKDETRTSWAVSFVTTADVTLDVDWTPESFDCLQIPSDTKTMLLSLAKSRLGLIPTVPFDDVIDGKGQGLNVLLNGPPGVGKTFTIEATSEYFKRPLYSISAGELVVDHGDSHALESQLEIIFKIAKHFNAFLLLDEADAFMASRTELHDNHNRLVTVFLRKLEYYRGLLFLTSNRGIQFDEAILSRIHLTIEYEDLTRESSAQASGQHFCPKPEQSKVLPWLRRMKSSDWDH